MKRLLAILLSMAAALGLAACGGTANNTSSGGAGSAPQSAAAPSSSTESSEAPSEENVPAASNGPLKVVTTSDSYKVLFDKFTEDTGIKVEYLSMSSGEVLSKVKAEGGAPMADLWFGGGIDAFMQAKEDGLLEQVEFDGAADLAPEYKDADNYWFSKGLTVVGFIVNNDILAEKNLELPKTWDDLTNPAYKSEILMSNPAISGTNYAVVNAILQTKGEEAGWKYFGDLNGNIDYYSKRGKDPSEKTAAGEIAIGITYLDKAMEKLQEEQNVTLVYPEDGIPYVPEGVAVFKGGTNADGAKEFIKWFYQDENLREIIPLDNKDTVKIIKPSLENVELSFPVETLMKEDLSLFGSERSAILDKWNAMIGDKAETDE